METKKGVLKRGFYSQFYHVCSTQVLRLHKKTLL